MISTSGPQTFEADFVHTTLAASVPQPGPRQKFESQFWSGRESALSNKSNGARALWLVGKNFGFGAKTFSNARERVACGGATFCQPPAIIADRDVPPAHSEAMSSETQRLNQPGRREVRGLIKRAKREERPFEEIFLEMYGDTSSASDTTDDCKPLDGLSIGSFTQDAPTETAPLPASRLSSPQQRERLTALASLAKPMTQQSSHPPSESSIGTDHDSTYVRDLEAQAERCYNRHLVLEVLEIWKEELHKSRQQAELADLRYDEKIAHQCLGVMKHEFYKTEDLERRRRLKMFLAWKDRKLAIWAIHSWIIRHRENVVKKRAEDGHDVRAATVALSKWHLMAIESRQRRQDFRSFFFASKFGRRWLDIMYERRIARAMAVLEERYRAYRREKDVKLLQKFLFGWRGKAASSAAMEATAGNLFEQQQAKRSKNAAHHALSSMYTATAEGISMEATADEKFQASLMLRVLSADGQWRAKTRVIQEREEVADEFRTTKDQARAQRGFRKMRNAAAWAKYKDDEADAYYSRTTNDGGRHALRAWRAVAAARRGEVVVQEPPATPAARMSALRQYQQQQR